jgi:hyperosmotically inducible periplasmic protein
MPDVRSFDFALHKARGRRVDIREERASDSAYGTYVDPCAMNKKCARPHVDHLETFMKTVTFRVAFRLVSALALGLGGLSGATAYAQSDAMPASMPMSTDAAPAAPAAHSGHATKADRALGRAVRRALSKTQGFDVSGVFVRARDGAVTLSGTVRSGDQIRQAEEVTRTVQGVTSVSNKLTLFHGGNG